MIHCLNAWLAPRSHKRLKRSVDKELVRFDAEIRQGGHCLNDWLAPRSRGRLKRSVDKELVRVDAETHQGGHCLNASLAQRSRGRLKRSIDKGLVRFDAGTHQGATEQTMLQCQPPQHGESTFLITRSDTDHGSWSGRSKSAPDSNDSSESLSVTRKRTCQYGCVEK